MNKSGKLEKQEGNNEKEMKSSGSGSSNSNTLDEKIDFLKEEKEKEREEYSIPKFLSLIF